MPGVNGGRVSTNGQINQISSTSEPLFTPSASFIPHSATSAWPDADHSQPLIPSQMPKNLDYSTPQKATNPKFVDEQAEQEFEIRTF